MVVNLLIDVSMKNGEHVEIKISESDPKGIIRDDGGEEREVILTEKDVLMEYSRRITKSISERTAIVLIDEAKNVNIVNPEDVSSIKVKLI